MSRITDALRHAANRSGGSVETTLAPVRPEHAFAAPWTFPGESAGEGPSKDGGGLVRLLEDREPFAFRGFNPEWTDRLATSSKANLVLVEQFRRLAAKLHQAQSAGPLKRVMVTSATPGDGKTLTAVNLALILSESYGRSVLLIDGDLRRPSIHNLSQLGDIVGLSEGLENQVEQKLAILRLTKTLALLPAGRPVSDPMRGLTSLRMKRILEEAAERFDWVIVDAPPVGPVADAALLAAMVDTSLFVIRAGYTPHGLVEKAIEGLGRDRIFGIVLNAMASKDMYTYGTYYGVSRDDAAV